MNLNIEKIIRRILILIFLLSVSSIGISTAKAETFDFPMTETISQILSSKFEKSISIRGSPYYCPENVKKTCEVYGMIQNLYITRMSDDDLTAMFIRGVTGKIITEYPSKHITVITPKSASFDCGIHTQKLCDAFDTVKKAINSSDSKITQLFIDGVFSEINITDVYSRYIPQGKATYPPASYAGIGMVTSKDANFPSHLIINRVVEGAPAFNAGLKRGDKITHVDGKSLAYKTEKQSNELIRGEPLQRVTLTIIAGCDTEPRHITIVRKNILDVSAGKLKVIDDRYAYVLLTDFMGNTANTMRTAIEQFRGSHGEPKGLIIDLRNNPGGFVKNAVELVGLFVEKGDVFYEQSQDGRYVPWQIYHGSKDIIPGTPIVILVNGSSASASELAAGAFQDFGRATIIGTNTYGKGVAQNTFFMHDGSKLYLTVSHTFTPNRTAIHKVGIHPDVVVSEGSNESCTGDAQLQDAIRALNDKTL
ncbi:MAG: S41 family peptidase [Candidatus Paceibacterota bacterium]|jgi:carboxyl-terminal processing protease|nr:S41 family peptidase [Candidatus Paceibacterota bacterium]